MALFRLFSAIFAIFFLIWSISALVDFLGGEQLLMVLGGIVTVALSFGLLWVVIDKIFDR